MKFDFLSNSVQAELAVSPALLMVSGGPDSTFLFHLFCALKKNHGAGFRVLHVNHALRGADSDGDETFVRDLCDAENIPCHVERLSWHSKRISPDASRQERRRLVFELQRECRFESVVTAHHFDDLLETWLMRRERGAGLSGAVGIKLKSVEQNPLADKLRVEWRRPLLGITKSQILGALADSKISYRQDLSNEQPSQWRNRIRQRLNQNSIEFVAKAGFCHKKLIQADAYWNLREQQAAEQCRNQVSWAEWQVWPEELQFRFLQRALRQAGFEKPFLTEHYVAITQLGVGKQFQLGKWQILRTRDNLQINHRHCGL